MTQGQQYAVPSPASQAESELSSSPTFPTFPPPNYSTHLPSAHDGEGARDAGFTSKGSKSSIVVFCRIGEFVNHFIFWTDNETDPIFFVEEGAEAVEGGGPFVDF